MGMFKLGETDSYSVTHFIYYLGFPIILYKAIQFGKIVKLESIFGKTVNGQLNLNAAMFNQGTDGASVKGFILGTAYLIIFIILWRLFCELLLMLFRYFESNTKKENLSE